STVTVHTTTAASSGQVSFTANPSSIMLATGATTGTTTLSWNAPGYSALQIRVSGVLFAAGLPTSGSIDTGNWVSDGLPFSLVDPASGQTIATLTMRITSSSGQVTFTASPNPIGLSTGTRGGKKTLHWN